MSRMLLSVSVMLIAATSVAYAEKPVLPMNVSQSKDHLITTLAISPAIPQRSVSVTQAGFHGASGGGFDDIASKDAKGKYIAWSGGTICGKEYCGQTTTQAVQFTIGATTSEVKGIKVALSYVAGTDTATVALYSDDSGVPGAELAGKHVAASEQTFGGCCAITSISFAAVTLQPNTPYWIVVTADRGSYLNWNFQDYDEVDAVTSAYTYGDGWYTVSSPWYTYAVDVVK
jgi:hypothetical protein